MKRKPSLKPIKLTDNELERLSVISEADIIKAAQEWKEHASRKELLEAQPLLDEIERDVQ